MNCFECGSEKTSVAVEQLSYGKKITVFFCESCARKMRFVL